MLGNTSRATTTTRSTATIAAEMPAQLLLFFGSGKDSNMLSLCGFRVLAEKEITSIFNINVYKNWGAVSTFRTADLWQFIFCSYSKITVIFKRETLPML